jgi:hypothetical protein
MVENAEKLKWNTTAKKGGGVLEVNFSLKDVCK